MVFKATSFTPEWAAYTPGFLRATSVTANIATYPATTHFRVTGSVVEQAEYQAVKPRARFTALILQFTQPAPEVYDVTATYPTLIGLTYPVGVKPTFSNKIDTHTSGKETATSFWQYPRWTFDLQYDYLPYGANVQTGDFATLCGFFMQMNGSFQTFLFDKLDDNTVTNYQLAVSDGIEPSYDLVRPLGGYLEPVGQVDPSQCTVSVRLASESRPVGTGPYTAQTVHHTGGIVDYGASHGATTLNKVVGPPASGQYNVDEASGTYTFNSDLSGQTVNLSYQYTAQPGTDYGIQMPRTLVFNSAPPAGALIFVTFKFFFTCRFVDDHTDFDQFMDKLYELQKVSLITVIE